MFDIFFGVYKEYWNNTHSESKPIPWSRYLLLFKSATHPLLLTVSFIMYLITTAMLVVGSVLISLKIILTPSDKFMLALVCGYGLFAMLTMFLLPDPFEITIAEMENAQEKEVASTDQSTTQQSADTSHCGDKSIGQVKKVENEAKQTSNKLRVHIRKRGDVKKKSDDIIRKAAEHSRQRYEKEVLMPFTNALESYGLPYESAIPWLKYEIEQRESDKREKDKGRRNVITIIFSLATFFMGVVFNNCFENKNLLILGCFICIIGIVFATFITFAIANFIASLNKNARYMSDLKEAVEFYSTTNTYGTAIPIPSCDNIENSH